MAAGAREVDVEPRTTVMRAGDPGDTYWVIVRGSVVVSPPGAPDKVLGPGAGFGEIALLHDVPRTATVRAASALRALVIDRP